MLTIKNQRLRTQDQIMASWGDSQTVAVSIVCAAFNHELYIEDALTGFLIQETTFPFEIIIHDDASTDRTATIIRQYQSRYPKIIKPIFQKENQYSKGGFKATPYAASFAVGEFIAICEGDDYWICKTKLARQRAVLLEHDVLLCMHGAYSLFTDGATELYGSFENRDQWIAPSQMIEGDGGIVATCSLFLHASIFKQLPPWFYNVAPVADYYIQVISSYPKGAYYLAEPMSVYRREFLGSWSSTYNTNVNKKITTREKLLLANIECEKMLDDSSLKQAFSSINYVHFCVIFKVKKSQQSPLELYRYCRKSFNARYIRPMLIDFTRLLWRAARRLSRRGWRS